MLPSRATVLSQESLSCSLPRLTRSITPYSFSVLNMKLDSLNVRKFLFHGAADRFCRFGVLDVQKVDVGSPGKDAATEHVQWGIGFVGLCEKDICEIRDCLFEGAPKFIIRTDQHCFHGPMLSAIACGPNPSVVHFRVSLQYWAMEMAGTASARLNS